MITINNTKIFYGANLYSKEPIVLLNITINSTSNENITFTCKKMQELFPEYFDKNISLIDDNLSIYFANTITNFAFNLINKNNGVISSYGVRENNNTILAWVEFNILHITIKALELTINLFIRLIQNKDLANLPINKLFDNYTQLAQRYNFFAADLLLASKELDIPSFQYSSTSPYRQYGWGKNSRIFSKTSPFEDGYHGVSISMDKAATKELLMNIGMPVVKDVIIHSKDQLEQAITKIGYPCVVKPIRGCQANGISVNISNFSELQEAFDYAKRSSFGNNPIMIEKFIEGNATRLIIVRGKFIGSIEKIAPTIIGDGKSTIKNLIEQINSDRKDPLKNIEGLKPIKIDDVITNYLKKFNLTLENVLENKREFKFGTTCTYGHHGASIIKTTQNIHPDNVKMGETIAKVTKIDILAIDYITTDMSKSFHENNGAICEINHFPGFGSFEPYSHANLSELEFARSIIGYDVGRIPAYLFIIDFSKIYEFNTWLKNNIKNNNIGWLCNNEAYIGNLPLIIYDHTAWADVKLLLRQKTLSTLMIACTKEDIFEKGLPLDKFNYLYVDKNINLNGWENVIKNATSNLIKVSEIKEAFFSILNDVNYLK